jgi:hypothetical protein
MDQFASGLLYEKYSSQVVVVSYRGRGIKGGIFFQEVWGKKRIRDVAGVTKNGLALVVVSPLGLCTQSGTRSIFLIAWCYGVGLLACTSCCAVSAF